MKFSILKFGIIVMRFKLLLLVLGLWGFILKRISLTIRSFDQINNMIKLQIQLIKMMGCIMAKKVISGEQLF